MSAGWRAALWLALLGAGLAGSLAWLALRPETAERDPHAEARLEMLYPLPLADIAAVEIVAGGRLVRFERDAAGLWLLHAHGHGGRIGDHVHRAEPRDAARIAKALEMSARTRIERRLPFEPSQRATYGLAYPPLILILYAQGQARPVLTVEAGDRAPDTISRYAYLPERGLLVTIPDYHVANLAELVAASEAGG
jgi:hypothetical protein